VNDEVLGHLGLSRKNKQTYKPQSDMCPSIPSEIAVAQLVEALRCKPEDREFSSFQPHYGPEVD